MSKDFDQLPKIGITLGDINGIGPEVILKSLLDQRLLSYFTPIIYGSTKTLSYYSKNFKLSDFQYTKLKSEDSLIPGKINVCNCWTDMIEISAGQPSAESSKAARLSLLGAVKALKSGFLDAVVTGPIDKHNIQDDDFRFPGHTEFFTHHFESKDSLMLLVSESMRMGVVTSHVPLKNVVSEITPEKVSSKLKIMNKTLKRDFGIQRPRIAVLGINPHNGDQGLIGTEEIDFLNELINQEKENGILAYGPFPADSFFGEGKFSKFDGILAMYHDQGLIPFKTLSFGRGVNFTAGLPIIRTSPDHGTAFSIAGEGSANENSMRQAIYLAKDLAVNRKENS